jgi:hypothetical protein
MFKNTLFNIFVVFCFLSPTNELFYLIGYLFLLVNSSSIKQNITQDVKIKVLLFIMIVISYFINYDNNLIFKDYLNAFNLMFLIFLFPYFGYKRKVYSVTIIIIISVILISQLAYVFSIDSISKVINLVYLNESSEIRFDRYIQVGRNGGLYFNPNQASKYLTMLLALTFLCVKANHLKSLIVAGILFSVLLTGSRTGLIVSIMIISVYVFYIKKSFKYGFITLFLGISVLLLNESQIIEKRNLQYSDTGSLDYKFDVLFEYLSKVFLNGNIADLLFGNFTSQFDLISSKFEMSYVFDFGFDAELGMLISFIGVISFVLILLFYIKQFRILFKTDYILLTIPFIFWPLTSTILFSFKTSLLYLSILGYGVSYVRSLKY